MQSTSETDAGNARGRIIGITLGLGTFLTQFDVTSVVIVLPAIGRDLGIAVPGLAWIIDAYSIAFTASLLVAGALADRSGRRRTLLIGNAGFLLASLGCGAAWNTELFMAARAAQGGSAAFLITGAVASIATSFPAPGARARAFGLMGVVSGVAMALGPSLGGALGSWFGWRWIFLANVPICVAIAIAVPRLVGEWRVDTDKPLDWSGVIALTLALGLAIEAVLQARHALEWTAVELAVAAGLLRFFILRQRGQPRPMIDPAVFASRSMAGAAVVLMAVSIGYWAVLVYLPLFLTAAFGWTADAAGLAMLAATLPMVVVPPFGGRLASRLGWQRLFAAAMTMIAAGGMALATSSGCEDATARLTWVFVGMALLGVGAALSHPQLSGVIVALAPPEAGGMASAVTIIARQAGFALGVAALGALAPAELAAAGFAWVFCLAASASAGGVLACRLLPAR